MKIKFSIVKIIDILLYTLSIIFLLWSVFNFYYSKRILPGVYLNNYNFSGLNQDQALSKIKKLSDSSPKNIIIYYSNDPTKSDDIYEVSFEDVEMNYNIEDTYNKLFSVGRSDFYSPLFLGIKSLFSKNFTGEFLYSINEEKLDLYISNLASQNFPQHSNAHFVYIDNQLIAKDASRGVNLDSKDLKKQILNNLSKGKFVYTAKTEKFVPTIFSEDLEVVKPQVEIFLNSEIKLKYLDIIIVPNNEEKLLFLDFIKSGKNLDIVSNTVGIESYSKIVASQINVDPKSTTLEITGNEINFEPPVVGLSLNEEKLMNDIKKYIENYNFSNLSNDSHLFVLIVNETKPQEDNNKYGITELIAEGVSYYRGSSTNRISNINTASEKIKGTLVAPGENFSFNEAVGPITLDEGFNTAYVISKGRTVLGTGGGVCQVSTTVFRAALNAGLPIVERTAHAYRVSYYEQDSPIGYDATIYQPSVDFVFKNDMDSYILVYTENDITNRTLKVKIYGTKDNRIVKLTEPKMLSELAPPEPVYIDDDTLPKGTVIQVEYPAWGGTVSFERTVMKNNEVLYKDTFKNYYTPWAAVYKKGTK